MMSIGRDCQGITLLELLFVVVIVGVLTAMALPGVGNIYKQWHISEAQSALLSLQGDIELYYSRHREYPSEINLLNSYKTLRLSEIDSYEFSLELSSQKNGIDYVLDASPKLDYLKDEGVSLLSTGQRIGAW